MGVSEDSQQVRRLARAVMSGELTCDEYRRQRRVLIDRHAGDVPMTSPPVSTVGVGRAVPNTLTEPTVPVSLADADIPTMAGGNRTHPRQSAVMNDTAEGRPVIGGRGDVWIGVVAVAIVLLIVGGLLAFFW